MTKRLSRLKLVFWLLVRIFVGIMTHFLTVIILDLAKVLSFLVLLILLFDFGSIDANGGGSLILKT